MKSSSVTIVVAGLLLNIAIVNADVVLDTSISAGGQIAAGENNVIAITEEHGSLKGGNLFHSFSEFNIASEETALFTGPDSVQNIISRVTGGESTINGTIASDIPAANLWLINPEGILFGDNASLDVQGSFHASTADYIQLRDGTTRFYGNLNLRESDILIPTPPQSFGFISDSIATPAELNVGNAKLTVPESYSITLLGSDVSLKGALISAPGGNISVVSINEAGDVIYSDQGLDTSSIENYGDLSIDSTAFTIDGEQKGSLQIKGGDLEINSSDTDFVSSVTTLKTTFSEDQDLLEKPCELADFYNQGKMQFIVNEGEDETEYGVKTKKTRRGPIGAIEEAECL